AALDGILSGRGSSTLVVNGRTVQIDASALLGPYLALDYAYHDPSVPFSVNMLPGEHYLKTYGGDYLYFTVNLDGTIAYDPALDGILSGRGTGALVLL